MDPVVVDDVPKSTCAHAYSICHNFCTVDPMNIRIFFRSTHTVSTTQIWDTLMNTCTVVHCVLWDALNPLSACVPNASPPLMHLKLIVNQIF